VSPLVCLDLLYYPRGVGCFGRGETLLNLSSETLTLWASGQAALASPRPVFQRRLLRTGMALVCLLNIVVIFIEVSINEVLCMPKVSDGGTPPILAFVCVPRFFGTPGTSSVAPSSFDLVYKRALPARLSSGRKQRRAYQQINVSAT
jgi:hypothetical protein